MEGFYDETADQRINGDRHPSYFCCHLGFISLSASPLLLFLISNLFLSPPFPPGRLNAFIVYEVDVSIVSDVMFSIYVMLCNVFLGLVAADERITCWGVCH
jgi:hypothetical protein